MEERESSTGSQAASEQGQKVDVFLSHSGKQKDFIKELYTDLTNQGVSCFFDQDRDSLPLAEAFPPRIFEAIKTCQVAVLLLSNDFLASKWPMLELAAFVEARDIKRTNPNLKIFPLFFRISAEALKNTVVHENEWEGLGVSREKRDEWKEALKVIRPINGLPFVEGDDEVNFRDEIVKQIWHMIHSTRYHIRGMQGEARMCQEVAKFFDRAKPQKGGVRIVGLYGIAGQGKTTLGKAFCNFNLGQFQGKVCHLEFRRGDPFERAKLALSYLTHPPPSYLETLTNEDKAKVELHKRVKGKRVLLVLDNITEESRDEVRFYVDAELGKNSWILLSAQSGEVLKKNFQIDTSQSCMPMPSLTEEEAIKILLETASPVESTVKKKDRDCALKCAETCLFKEDRYDNARRFHPLALKAFGGYLFSKYGLNLRKWVGEIDGMVDRPGEGLDEVFAVLMGKTFDDISAKYRTIFMLLTVYILPNMSLGEVIEWMAIICNEKFSFILKALQDLRDKALIEEFEPQIRIHDLYIKFAQRKADKMDRWLWWKQDLQYDPRGLIPEDKKQDLQYDPRGLISEDKDGFELAKLEHCVYEEIGPDYLRNLLVLQLVNVQDMSTLDLDPMMKLRSITLRDCKSLKAVEGMEKLRDLSWLQINGVNQMFKLPDISRIRRLQHLEIDIPESRVIDQLGDVSNCYRLREIYVVCPSLTEFPRLESMKHLAKVEFSLCDQAKGPLDCRDCEKLEIIVLSKCGQMADSPMLAGCKKLKSLKLVKCGIRRPPDLTGCDQLEDVYFYSLRNLERFPNFSILRELKKLSICDCIRVMDPPDIGACLQLQVFRLLYKHDNGPSKIFMVSDRMDFGIRGGKYKSGNWLKKVVRYFEESIAPDNGPSKIFMVSDRMDFGTRGGKYKGGNWLKKVVRYLEGSIAPELEDEKVTFTAASEGPYNVYINYRGPDMRELGFALYSSLVELGFRTFLDVQELEVRTCVMRDIKNAIYSSKVQIAIFSPRYAESHWCLSELVYMQTTKALIIPVFCDVKPSDLRYPDKGAFAPAFAEHHYGGRYDRNLIERWKTALRECANMHGYVFSTSDGNVEELCAKISENVKRLVGSTSMGFPSLLR